MFDAHLPRALARPAVLAALIGLILTTPPPETCRADDEGELVTQTQEGRIKSLRLPRLRIVVDEAVVTTELTKETRYFVDSYEFHPEYLALTGAWVRVTSTGKVRGDSVRSREAQAIRWRVGQVEGTIVGAGSNRLTAEVVVPKKDEKDEKDADGKDKDEKDKDDDKGRRGRAGRQKDKDEDDKPKTEKVTFLITKYTELSLDGKKVERVNELKKDTKVTIAYFEGDLRRTALAVVAGDPEKAKKDDEKKDEDAEKDRSRRRR